MKLVRLLTVSAAPWLSWVLVAGCGEGGGFRSAFTESGATGGSVATAGSGAGGLDAGAMGLGGAGMGGLTTDAGAGGAGFGGQAGSAGAASGIAGMGGFASDGNGAAGSGGAGGAASGGVTSGGGAGAMAGNAGVGAGAMAGNGANAGKGGQSGAASGGAAGAAGPQSTCAERCNGDADCRVFSVDQGYRCNASTHRCQRFAEPCRSSVECLPGSSFWVFSCNTDVDCFFFSDDLCVDVGGVGRCARLAPSANGCSSPTPDEVTLPRFGAAGNALVCANADQTCESGACVPACDTNADCTPARNGSVCDTSSGLCRCVSDEDCGGAGVSHCNTASGRCECSDARDCEEIPNTNVCSMGRCGCTSVTACNAERTFSGTSYVCE